LASGLELSGGWELNPASSCLQTLILSENRLKISILGQNFKHFDSWPPSSYRSISTLVGLKTKNSF